MFCWSGAGKLYGLNQSAAELQLINQAQRQYCKRLDDHKQSHEDKLHQLIKRVKGGCV